MDTLQADTRGPWMRSTHSPAQGVGPRVAHGGVTLREQKTLVPIVESNQGLDRKELGEPCLAIPILYPPSGL